MVSKVMCVGLWGLEGYTVEVETDSRPAQELRTDIVGLPDAAIKEARDRIYSAVRNCGFRLPDAQIILNLAPADIKKEGVMFDLPMLLGVLSSTGQIPVPPSSSAFIGEISLSGDIRRGNGVLASVIAAKEMGFKEIFVPAANAAEGAVTEGITVFGAETVKDVILHITGEKPLQPYVTSIDRLYSALLPARDDFRFIVGQQSAKRACEISAAGGHNMLLIGPPGTGKSMLAKSLPSILPEMSFDEIIECSKIYSVAGKLSEKNPLCLRRPFVRSNQNVSVAGMTGGGSVPSPGLISLAHNGILFLDETAEFPVRVLETLRQPLEDGTVTVSRVKKTLTYPSSFMLVCAMNPCPCGYYGHPSAKCTCSPQQIERYLGKISGPLIDRIDLQVAMPPVSVNDIKAHANTVAASAEPSVVIKERVDLARQRQQIRFKGAGFSCNAKMTPQALRETVKISSEASALLTKIFEKTALSMRSYDKIIKIAQTVADLSESEEILPQHISEAVYFRSLDKKYRR